MNQYIDAPLLQRDNYPKLSPSDTKGDPAFDWWAEQWYRILNGYITLDNKFVSGVEYFTQNFTSENDTNRNAIRAVYDFVVLGKNIMYVSFSNFQTSVQKSVFDYIFNSMPNEIKQGFVFRDDHVLKTQIVCDQPYTTNTAYFKTAHKSNARRLFLGERVHRLIICKDGTASQDVVDLVEFAAMRSKIPHIEFA